jgi:hypothetical protein
MCQKTYLIHSWCETADWDAVSCEDERKATARQIPQEEDAELMSLG